MHVDCSCCTLKLDHPHNCHVHARYHHRMPFTNLNLTPWARVLLCCRRQCMTVYLKQVRLYERRLTGTTCIAVLHVGAKKSIHDQIPTASLVRAHYVDEKQFMITHCPFPQSLVSSLTACLFAHSMVTACWQGLPTSLCFPSCSQPPSLAILPSQMWTTSQARTSQVSSTSRRLHRCIPGQQYVWTGAFAVFMPRGLIHTHLGSSMTYCQHKNPRRTKHKLRSEDRTCTAGQYSSEHCCILGEAADWCLAYALK
jgi:hypothetical protein